MKLSDNFDSTEFGCPCKACAGIEPIVAPELIENLEKLRSLLNADLKPGEKEHGLTVNSGCRCPARNKIDHGAANSQHLYDPITRKAGRAADVYSTTRSTREVYQAAITIPGFKGIGLAPPTPAAPPDPSTHRPGRPARPGYVHLDVRSGDIRANWGYDESGAVVALSSVLPKDWTV